MSNATDVFAAVAALVRDNYATLATGNLSSLTVLWGNEAGDEDAVHLRVHDGSSSPVTDDLEGGSSETILCQIDCVTPAGDYTARNRAMVSWITDLFYVGRRVGPATVITKPAPASPVPGSADYRVPVTIVLNLMS